MKYSVIIPCYNEAQDIVKNAEIIKDYFNSKNLDYELLLVNDGSKDNTKEVIESIQGVKALSYDVNRGKGGAVKYGIENATGDYVLFMDADLSTDLEAVDKVVENAPNYDMIIGSRHAKDSVIKKKQPALRVFIGWCCRQLVNMKFHTKLKDTQCGFKAIKADIAKRIVEKQLIDKFAFDVEYIYIAKLNNLTMKEIGVIWSDDRTSTVSPFKSSVRFFKDINFIKRHKSHYYFNEADIKKGDGKWVIFLMVFLLLAIVALFVVFLILKANNTI